MSVNRLTEQQERAITAGDVSVALAAGAGCGKTFVLTERFLSCLDPARPGGPAAVGPVDGHHLHGTGRPRNAPADPSGLHASDCSMPREEDVDYWLRTVRELDSARIATIHSYCGTLLRSHAVEARLDPHFQVLDAAATQTVLYELVDEQLRERLAARDEAVIDLVVKYGLAGLARDGRPAVGPAASRSIGTPGAAETPGQLLARWEDFWRNDTLPRVLGQSEQVAGGGEDPANRPPGNAVHAVMRDALRIAPRQAAATGCEAADPAAALAEIREAARVQGGGGKKAWSSEAVYEDFRNAAEELRAMIDKVARSDGLRPGGGLSRGPGGAQPPGGHAAAWPRPIGSERRELAALDFDDLLIRARDLLTGRPVPSCGSVWPPRPGCLLVDEFQDTDPLQVELVRALCDGRVADGKLFFVGDYKQSIYRFRGADPHVFRRLRDEIPARRPLAADAELPQPAGA